jgi:hypothetical protein
MHLPTTVVQALFALQLPVCLYVGYRTAQHTRRRVLDWLVFGFLAAIVFPPLGAVITLVLFFVCPPARDGHTPTDPHGAPAPAGPCPAPASAGPYRASATGLRGSETGT